MPKNEHLEAEILDALAYLSARDRELVDAVKLNAAVREGRAPSYALDEAERAMLDAINEQRGAAGILRRVSRALEEE